MKAADVVTDALRKIVAALQEGSFDRGELEGIIKICDRLKESTQKVLDKGPISDQPPESDNDK